MKVNHIILHYLTEATVDVSRLLSACGRLTVDRSFAVDFLTHDKHSVRIHIIFSSYLDNSLLRLISEDDANTKQNASYWH